MEAAALSVNQLAERWSVNKMTLYTAIREHKLRAFRVGTTLRIPMEEIARVEGGDDWRDRHER